MQAPIKHQLDTEHQLWRNVIKGDTGAFEQLVVKYQSAVSAVAFSIIGDFSSSQDIAQETFWAAWKTREKLRDAGRLGAWLCGIARNMAKQWRRRTIRANEVDQSALSRELSSNSIDPADKFISQEEESLVWKTLEQIPENYREVLVLYYRQGHSIEEVANTLGLTNSAARQRLARGREMLRSRISSLIEGVLDRSNPSRTFTARVMAGITMTGFASQSAVASAASVSSATKGSAAVATAKLLASGSMGGLAGGLIGVLGGLGGAWLGSWLPAQFAPTETERQLLLERSRPILGVGILFSAAVLALSLGAVFYPAQRIAFFAGVVGLMMPFIAWMVLHSHRTQTLVKKLRKELSPEEDPNQSKLAQRQRKMVNAPGAKLRGRRYTSSLSLFGLPLVDVQVSDPAENMEGYPSKHEPRVARGWIAIGDVAHGILLAIGGRAFGAVAFGGISTGLISVGGVSIGLVSLGGVALGMLAFGGAAIGYDACGGGAVGWHSAAGGGAVAYYVAAGGGAVAYQYAVGGSAVANEANTEIAKTVADNESFMWMIESPWFSTVATVIAVAIPLLVVPFFYTRKPEDEPEGEKKPPK